MHNHDGSSGPILRLSKDQALGRKETVMKIIGCDYHPSGQQVFGIDTESGEIFADRWIAHTGRELEEFYRQLPAGAVVGVESSGNMLWFERRLAQWGHRLRLGDAAQIRARETRKQKHDRRDAELIARLLMSNVPLSRPSWACRNDLPKSSAD